MILRVCLTFGKPTAFIAKEIIIFNGGIYPKICDSIEILGNLTSCIFPIAFIPS